MHSLCCAVAPVNVALTDPMAKRTRITVKILEGKNLLVSDLLTGTSDPMALLWVGSCEEGDVDLKYDKRVQVIHVVIGLTAQRLATGRVTVKILT